MDDNHLVNEAETDKENSFQSCKHWKELTIIFIPKFHE